MGTVSPEYNRVIVQPQACDRSPNSSRSREQESAGDGEQRFGAESDRGREDRPGALVRGLHDGRP